MGLFSRVANLNDIELISKETNCVKSFISRGVSLASFIQARCLDLGKGTKPDSEMAKQFYKRVIFRMTRFFIINN
jgi:hypothetical protein